MITKRQIEYSCTTMPLSSTNMPKQSSSFVSISSPSQLQTHDKPIFGVIVAHSFTQSKYFWAVVEQFRTAEYDSDVVCINQLRVVYTGHLEEGPSAWTGLRLQQDTTLKNFVQMGAIGFCPLAFVWQKAPQLLIGMSW